MHTKEEDEKMDIKKGRAIEEVALLFPIKESSAGYFLKNLKISIPF